MKTRVGGCDDDSSVHSGPAYPVIRHDECDQQAGIIHQWDKGSQSTSLALGNRCREAGVRSSTGSVGDAYDNACDARASLQRSNAS
jgi:transposase InsO family protein